MEKINFVKNGVIKLPPGFRFHPTDEELVVQYLKRKVFAYPLPASIIPEVDVCKYNPWDLPGDSEQERYFFSTREAKYRNGNRPNRAAGCGHWKATGVDKKIVVSRSNQVVGMKKTLVFYRGKTPSRSRTDWIMHEYRLVGDASTQNSITQMGDWVLCRIFLKQRNNKNDDEIAQPCNKHRVLELRVARPNHFIDFMMQEKTNRSPSSSYSSSSSSSSSSSGSSGITEVSSPESDHEENSSFNSVTASPCRRQP